MSAATIAAALGDAKREGRGWRCRCPLHGGRSLTLRDGGGGRVLVLGFCGCGARDVLAGLHRRGLPHGGTPAFPPTVARTQRPHHTAHRIACARRIWDGAHEALQSPVVRYLARRGITVAPPASLRWAPHCWHRKERAYLPAMVGLVEHVEHGIVGVHRTYLTPDCCRRDRASLGPIGGGAGRLGDIRPDGWPGISEGRNTALA